MEPTLQEFLEMPSDKELMDIKLSLGDAQSAPSEIMEQVKSIIQDGNAGKLENFIDY